MGHLHGSAMVSKLARNDVEQGVQVERLLQERHPGQINVVIDRAQQNDRDTAVLQLVGEAHPIHLRHHHVREHEVGWLALNLLQRRPPIARAADSVAFLSEQFHHHIEDVKVIVDDQDRSVHQASLSVVRRGRVVERTGRCRNPRKSMTTARTGVHSGLGLRLGAVLVVPGPTMDRRQDAMAVYEVQPVFHGAAWVPAIKALLRLLA
jgi:hypothetical protein